MSSVRPHRVFRCTFEVFGVPRASAEEWRRRARALWEGEFAPRLAAELDASFPRDDVVSFSGLEVELRLSERADNAEIGHQFRLALQESLGNKLQRSPVGGTRPGLDVGAGSGEARDWLQVWLVTGLVPWWGGKPSTRDIAENLLGKIRAASGPSWLQGILIQSPTVARRLALQFDDVWQTAALTQVRPAERPGRSSSGMSALTAFFSALTAEVMAQVASPSIARAALWEACWRLWSRADSLSAELQDTARAASQNQDAASLQRFGMTLLREAGWAAAFEPALADEHARCPSGTSASPSAPDAISQPPPDSQRPGAAKFALPYEAIGISEILKAPEAESVQGAAATETKAGVESSALPAIRAAKPSEAAPTALPARKVSIRPGEAFHAPRDATTGSNAGAELETALTPGLPVVHAGLVLIAPFLPRFFDALEIRLSRDPAERQGAELAPLLLHFLANASNQAAEHELTIPKILSAVPFEEPVVCEHTFPEAAVTEVDRLLAAVLKHWPALKNTSIQGLRESFVQRAGLLRDAGEQWQLRVEHRAWDVLLDRVPWTFRTIRLPWMLRPLMVEWEAYA